MVLWSVLQNLGIKPRLVISKSTIYFIQKTLLRRSIDNLLGLYYVMLLHWQCKNTHTHTHTLTLAHTHTHSLTHTHTHTHSLTLTYRYCSSSLTLPPPTPSSTTAPCCWYVSGVTPGRLVGQWQCALPSCNIVRVPLWSHFLGECQYFHLANGLNHTVNSGNSLFLCLFCMLTHYRFRNWYEVSFPLPWYSKKLTEGVYIIGS